MHWLPDLMHCTGAGVRVNAPKGEVWLRPTRDGIKADYTTGPLVNGNATAYAKAVKQTALDYAHELELPWSKDTQGNIRIKDLQRYYEHTFRPDILAAETLLRWESRSQDQ